MVWEMRVISQTTLEEGQWGWGQDRATGMWTWDPLPQTGGEHNGSVWRLVYLTGGCGSALP